MSQLDRAQAKQRIIQAAQQVIRVASMRSGLFAQRDQQYLLGAAVFKLNKALHERQERPEGESHETCVDPANFEIHWPSENDRCANMLMKIVRSIVRRWQTEDIDYFRKLYVYYEGWILDESGEPCEAPLGREDEPCPARPPVTISADELDRMEIVLAHYVIAEEVLLPFGFGECVDGEMPVSAARGGKQKKGRPRVNNERDEWIYSKYVEGVKIEDIIEELKKVRPDWDSIETRPGIVGAALRFAESRGLPKPRHGQGINHQLSPPHSN